MTDKQLIESFLTRRDEASFESLVLRHGPMVLGLCRQVLRDSHEAEDAFQATFLLLARNAATIKNLDSLASWLYGVAYRVSLKAKAGARRRAHEGPGVEMAVSEPLDLDRHDLQPLLHDEVNRLPEKYRAPILLCFFEGQTHEEAARQLNCPTGTVKGRMARAKEMLRSRLERRGLAMPVALIAMMLSREATAAVPRELVESTVAAALRATATIARPLRANRWLATAAVLILFVALAGRFVNVAARGDHPATRAWSLLRLFRGGADDGPPRSCHAPPSVSVEPQPALAATR